MKRIEERILNQHVTEFFISDRREHVCELSRFFCLEGWKQINSVVVTTAFWNPTWPKNEFMLFD